MNTRVKSSLLILLVLIIGIGIGFEISEMSIRSRFDKLDSFRKPGGFINMFEDIIKPNETQRPGIDSILVKYHDRMDKIAKTSMTEISQVMDSMKAELGGVISAEQKARLEHEMTRMKNQPPPMPRGRGRLPDGGEQMPEGRRPMPPPDERGPHPGE